MKRICLSTVSLAVAVLTLAAVAARAFPGGAEIGNAVQRFNERREQQPAPAAFVLDDVLANLFNELFGTEPAEPATSGGAIFFSVPTPMTAAELEMHPELLLERVRRVTGPSLRDAQARAVVRITMKLESRPQTLVLESPDGTRTFTISSGKKGHGTPRGCFTVDKTVRNYWSRKYNSPMPWSVFFHAGAYATHGTPYVGQLGAPASHGCVRLHPDNAKIVFETVNKYSRSKALLCIGS